MIQSLEIFGGGGTYTLTFDDETPAGGNPETTAALAYDADATAVEAALNLLANIPSGGVTVTGSGTHADPFLVTFPDAVDYLPIAIDDSLLEDYQEWDFQGAPLEKQVQLSSLTQTSVGGHLYYPGEWYDYDIASDTWTAQKTIWLIQPNGSTDLLTDKFYEGRQLGMASDGTELWAIVEGPPTEPDPTIGWAVVELDLSSPLKVGPYYSGKLLSYDPQTATWTFLKFIWLQDPNCSIIPDHTSTLNPPPTYFPVRKMGSITPLPARLYSTTLGAAYTRVFNTITADANGAIGNLDSVAPAVGDRILFNPGDADGGIWVIDDLGSPSTPFSLSRAPDFTGMCGTLITMSEGATQAGKMWVSTARDVILNFTTISLEWTGFSPETREVWMILDGDDYIVKTPILLDLTLLGTGDTYNTGDDNLIWTADTYAFDTSECDVVVLSSTTFPLPGYAIQLSTSTPARTCLIINASNYDIFIAGPITPTWTHLPDAPAYRLLPHFHGTYAADRFWCPVPAGQNVEGVISLRDQNMGLGVKNFQALTAYGGVGSPGPFADTWTATIDRTGITVTAVSSPVQVQYTAETFISPGPGQARIIASYGGFDGYLNLTVNGLANISSNGTPSSLGPYTVTGAGYAVDGNPGVTVRYVDGTTFIGGLLINPGPRLSGSGVNGTFTTVDGKTVTVIDGIITLIA